MNLSFHDRVCIKSHENLTDHEILRDALFDAYQLNIKKIREMYPYKTAKDTLLEELIKDFKRRNLSLQNIIESIDITMRGDKLITWTGDLETNSDFEVTLWEVRFKGMDELADYVSTKVSELSPEYRAMFGDTLKEKVIEKLL